MTFIQQCSELFRGLGMQVGTIGNTTNTDPNTGRTYRGHVINISGTQILALIDKHAIGYKRPVGYVRMQTDNTWNFTITQLPYHHASIGIRTDGDNEFLLAVAIQYCIPVQYNYLNK
jgi:hypothetical protein